jgi:hypothetical protein
MKKLLLLAVISTTSLISCSKEGCYECTQVITATAPGISPQITSNTFDFCGNKREVEGTTTSTTTVGSITATAKGVTKCKIK